LFYWHSKDDGKGNRVYTELAYLPNCKMKLDYSAYTTAELGEMLKGWEAHTEWSNQWMQYFIHYNGHSEQGDTEADARAKMLIYLAENNLIKITKPIRPAQDTIVKTTIVGVRRRRIQ
jgi:hypothetical protein